MLDINLVRENPAMVKASEKKRGKDPIVVDAVRQYDEQWRKALKNVEELKHRRNIVSEEINQAKKARKESLAQQKIKEMRIVADDIKEQEGKVQEFLAQRNQALVSLGNVLHPKVPAGKDASENKEIKTWGTKPKFSFPIKNHVELAEELGIADFDAAAKVSGNGFYYHKKELGLLNLALIRFAVDFMQKKGYMYIEPPLLLKKEMLGAAIDLEEWSKTVYSIEGEDLALIGTSEYAMLGMHAEETFPEAELPRRYTAYSMCFRKEIGAHGINEKGLWRRHQFNKVEQFIFCTPEESNQYFEELLQNSEEILQALELPYRVMELCAGDLASWKHRSCDLEVWRPTTNSYGEVMSLSNCTDYQARKLNIKVISKDGSRRVVHTLNNTALATSRIIVAILENFQTKAGTIKVPKALWPYMDGIKEIKNKEVIKKSKRDQKKVKFI